MNCGQCFRFVVSSLIAFALLVASLSTPYQLVFHTKPYARTVLAKGHLDGWTAEELDLEAGQFEMVKLNYDEYLRWNGRVGEGDSESIDSDSDSDEPLQEEKAFVEQHFGWTNETFVGGTKSTYTRMFIDESESSESDELEDSDSNENTVMQNLEMKPLRRTISLGLFSAKACSLSQRSEEECHTLSVSEALLLLSREMPFLNEEINLPLWNDLRVESLLSVTSCCIGIICLLTSFRPCGCNKYFPLYLGALSFAASGVMVFIPVIRILMITADFKQILTTELNITTTLGFTWSVLFAGLSVPFSVLAAILLVASKWSKTKRIVKKLLKTGNYEDEGRGTNGYRGIVKAGSIPPEDYLVLETGVYVDKNGGPVR